MTPESRDCLNRIKREGASSDAQFNNREAGIPSGPTAESEKPLYGIDKDRFSDNDISKEHFIILRYK